MAPKIPFREQVVDAGIVICRKPDSDTLRVVQPPDLAVQARQPPQNGNFCEWVVLYLQSRLAQMDCGDPSLSSSACTAKSTSLTTSMRVIGGLRCEPPSSSSSTSSSSSSSSRSSCLCMLAGLREPLVAVRFWACRFCPPHPGDQVRRSPASIGSNPDGPHVHAQPPELTRRTHAHGARSRPCPGHSQEVHPAHPGRRAWA